MILYLFILSRVYIFKSVKLPFWKHSLFFGRPPTSSFGHRCYWGNKLSLCFSFALIWSQSPEVQVQVLGLQNMYRWPSGAYMYRAVGGSEPRQRWIRSGKDVVNAKLDLWLWFSLLGGVWDEMVLLWTQLLPFWVQRAEGGTGLWVPGCWTVLIAVALQRLERGFSWITQANFHVSPAPTPPKVAIFKQVEHGFTASGKSPVISLPLLIALCPRNLGEYIDRKVWFTHIYTLHKRKKYLELEKRNYIIL